MKIENLGSGARCEGLMRSLVELCAEGRLRRDLERITVLPIPSTRDGEHVTGTDTSLSEIFSGAGEGSLIIGYGIPESYARMAASRGAETVDAALDGEFILRNAEITALGTLGYILNTRTRVPSELAVGIVGYGRIGSALVRHLLFLGAKVRLYTSKKLTRVELGECEIETVYTDYTGAPLDFSGLDVLINTAPADLSASFPSGAVPLGLLVIELASGNNFSGVGGVVSLQGIPERSYPDSATEAYLSSVLPRLLGGEV